MCNPREYYDTWSKDCRVGRWVEESVWVTETERGNEVEVVVSVCIRKYYIYI